MIRCLTDFVNEFDYRITKLIIKTYNEVVAKAQPRTRIPLRKQLPMI